MLLLVFATDLFVLPGFQSNDINFPFTRCKGESTRRGKCKRKSPIGLKQESSCKFKDEEKRISKMILISMFEQETLIYIFNLITEN